MLQLSPRAGWLSEFDSELGEIEPTCRAPASWQAPERDKIAHWVFVAQAFAFAVFKTILGISKCNLAQGLRDPVSITSD